MKLVKPINATKNSKRVGRGPGSGLGKTAGRGHKGAGQRSGFKHRYWFEGGQVPLHRRVPTRGFNNFNFAKTYEIVNLSQIAKIKSKKINSEILVAKGLISSAFVAVKILGNGDIDNAYNVTASAFSASAVKKIEEAGGKAIIQ
ncbi:MAG: 50S ribosomal protein L15 [bacterium TMED274]|nr:MAG: 50S ribosomal protein L15 [bacterium TMED274]|tara:strand:- start:19654 stop:20085 length:432 start_codon:yes stop_codon:yes gene_type:complete